MADVIMTYNSLETAAQQFSKAHEDLEGLIAFLMSAVGAMEGSYQGASYNALVNAWNASEPTMRELSDAIYKYAPALKDAVARQIETEAENTTRVGGCAF